MSASENRKETILLKSREPESKRKSSPLARSASLRMINVRPGATPEEHIRAQEEEIKKLQLLLLTADELATETSLDSLMTLIVERASKIMGCERTSVFLVDEDSNELYSLVAQGLDTAEIRFPISAGLAGYVARTGETLNVPDAYQDQRFNKEFDRKTGFRTRSVLAMPLPSRKGEVLGVIQCLNNHIEDNIELPFDQNDETFLAGLAGLAAIFLENAKLYRAMDKVFESVVSAVSHSIDARDPCTSGHSRRVTQYTLNLARAVHFCQHPPFDNIVYTRERFKQLRFASLMHDVGKIGVRENVLCKADKLTNGGLQICVGRLELMKERRKSQLLEKALLEKLDAKTLLETVFASFAGEVDAAIALITAKNTPSFVNDQELAQLCLLKEKGWITADEFTNLSIRRGNLTESEWDDMRSHVTKSYEMLIKIPWPRELRELPEVAYTHHEKRDGSGYPRKLKGDEIHFDGQCMCVADIYDALTASDRPYKKALPHEVAKKILIEEEGQKKKIMPELIQLFFDQECYKINSSLTTMVL